MRFFTRMIVYATFSVYATMNMGCTAQLGEGVKADADSEVGVATEALTQDQQNVLTCVAMSLATPGLSYAERQQFRRGCELYFNEEFGGNGRRCASCHLFIPANGNPDDNNFDLAIEDVEVAFLENPHGPLFRELDSDDGLSAAAGGVDGDFGTLRGLADVRIPLALHPNVTVIDDGSPLISEDARTVTVWRSTPTSENIRFVEQDEALMWDGRFPTLEIQAVEAVRTHYEPARDPTAQEAADLAFFQRHLFSNEPLRAFANGGPPPTIPEVPSVLTGTYWDSVRRGRNFFLDMPITSDAPVRGGHCATCHSGPMLDETNAFNPVQAPGQVINNNLASELNFLRPPETRLPEHTYEIVLDHPVFMPDVPIAHSPFFPPPGTPLFPPGTVFRITSTDLGLLMTQGDPCLVPTACLLNSRPPGPNGEPPVFSTASFFRTPTLWGAADSAPYFHDDSARTIQEAMAVYVFNFGITADGLNGLGLDGEPFRLLPQDVEDIINYFEYAFRHRPALLP